MKKRIHCTYSQRIEIETYYLKSKYLFVEIGLYFMNEMADSLEIVYYNAILPVSDQTKSY